MTNTEIFAKLLSKDAYGAVTVTDNWGWTPLHYAAFHNKISIVNLILANNVDVNQVTAASDYLIKMDDGYLPTQPLHEMFRTALQSGADPNRLDKQGYTPLTCAMLKK